MTETLQRTRIGAAAPLFIVSDLRRSLVHYAGLGFSCVTALPEDTPFFAIVERDAARLMLKEIGPDAPPLPNAARHPWAPWDAFLHTPDPDALAAELGRTAEDRDDGLRGFGIADPDGYVLYFGRPG